MNKQKKVKGQGYVIKMKLNIKYAKNCIRLQPFYLKKNYKIYKRFAYIFISNYLSLFTLLHRDLQYACFSFLKKKS